MVQMPNRAGLRSAFQFGKRGFTEGHEFDVRYYSIHELLGWFSDTIGPAEWSVDCFLGLNVHAADRVVLKGLKKRVVDMAEFLAKFSQRFPPLAKHADSVFISAIKPLRK